MIEALLLVSVLTAMVILLFNIWRASKPGEKKNLGLLAYVDEKEDRLSSVEEAKTSA